MDKYITFRKDDLYLYFLNVSSQFIFGFRWLLKEFLDLLIRKYTVMTFGKQRRTSKDFPFVSGMRIMVKTRATPTITPYIQKTRPAPRLFRRSRKVLVTRNVPAQLVPVAREAPRLLDLLGSSSPISSQGIGPNLEKI